MKKWMWGIVYGVNREEMDGEKNQKNEWSDVMETKRRLWRSEPGIQKVNFTLKSRAFECRVIC
jgi:hypothetical protein